MPSLLHVLEARPLIKSELSSLDLALNKIFMKMFRTNNMDIVRKCVLCWF